MSAFTYTCKMILLVLSFCKEKYNLDLLNFGTFKGIII